MEEDEWEAVSALDGEALERETGVVWRLDGEERARVRDLLEGRG
jgi:hypothetical protein